jgi:ribosomal protein S18 acetylase RimI-like enzyme
MNRTFEIELAKYEDLGGIKEIVKHLNDLHVDLSEEESMRHDGYDLGSIMDTYRAIFRDPDFGAIFVYKQGKEIRGLCSGIIKGNRGYVLDIWVDEDLRNSNLAWKLFSSMVEYFKFRSVMTVDAMVHCLNFEVGVTLERRGFQPIFVKYRLVLED